MTQRQPSRSGEQGSAVLAVLMLLVALAGIQTAVTQYGRSLERELRNQEERHNRQFREDYPSSAAS